MVKPTFIEPSGAEATPEFAGSILHFAEVQS